MNKLLNNSKNQYSIDIIWYLHQDSDNKQQLYDTIDLDSLSEYTLSGYI